jgi:hypothetical protein
MDEKTNQIKGYDSSYDINGRQVTTSVVIDKLRVVDGITVPRAMPSVRYEQITIYADFKTKEITVNTRVADDVFSVRELISLCKAAGLPPVDRFLQSFIQIDQLFIPSHSTARGCPPASASRRLSPGKVLGVTSVFR